MCSFHGTCTDEGCVCDPGYHDDDCSVPDRECPVPVVFSFLPTTGLLSTVSVVEIAGDCFSEDVPFVCIFTMPEKVR
jgi:hypothetical protein